MTPDHATLVFVGDLAADDAFALARRYFGDIPRSAVNGAVPRPPPVELPGEVQLDIRANVPTSRVILRWPTPRYLTTEDGWVDVLARVMSGTRNAWLYWELVDNRKVATSVRVQDRSRDLGSELEVAIDGAPGRSAGELLAAFDDSMDHLSKRQANATILLGAEYETLIGRITAVEDPWTEAASLAAYASLVGTAGYLEHDIQRFFELTPEKLRATLSRFMPRDRRVVALVTADPKAAAGGEKRDRRCTPVAKP